MAGSWLGASDAAQVTMGGAGAALVAVAILTATLGSNNGQVLAGARIPHAMARGGPPPRGLGGGHAPVLSPAPSLIVPCIIPIAPTSISTEASLEDTHNPLFTHLLGSG